jgi:hypothetical protein
MRVMTWRALLAVLAVTIPTSALLVATTSATAHYNCGTPEAEDDCPEATTTTAPSETTTTTEPPTTTTEPEPEITTTTTTVEPEIPTVTTTPPGPPPCAGDPDGEPCPYDERNPPAPPIHRVTITTDVPSFAG